MKITESTNPSSSYRTELIQKGTLIVSIACSVLSHIPSVRFGSAVTLRCAALLSATCLYSQKDTWGNKTRAALKVAVVAANIVALISSNTTLSIACTAIDTGLQAIALLATASKVSKIAHAGFIATNAAAIAALYTGDYEWMVASAAINMGSMFYLSAVTALSSSSKSAFEPVCYSLLAFSSLITILIVQPWLTTVNFVYELKNETENRAYFAGVFNTPKKHYVGEYEVAVLQPGESETLKTGYPSLIRVHIGANDKSVGEATFVHPTSQETQMDPGFTREEFLTAPIGSLVLATSDTESL